MTDIVAVTKMGLKKGKYKVSEPLRWDWKRYDAIIKVKDPNGDLTYVYGLINIEYKE